MSFLSECSAGVRRACAMLVISVALVTLLTCFTLTRVNHVYVGGMRWPFFSDMGRDVPNYYVFVVGLSTVAVAASLAFHFNGVYQRIVLSLFRREHAARGLLRPVKAFVPKAIPTVQVLGALSTIGLPVLVRLHPSPCKPTTAIG